ncbi:restriction endonuclease subunit S [Clostridium sp.]|uniref:restriction endonuclease subunit S n=1 Tax=Clostridium sp. TaxID=1506 RepID=UPI0026226AE4|nr:restriction endonuclease subunit S [Clostridium sp.]
MKNKDWEIKKLKEIGCTQTGNTPKTSNPENYGDFIPFVKPADIDILGNGEIRYDNEGLSKKGLDNARHIPKNSILMVCIGASIGKVGYTDRDVSCNQQINTLTVNKTLDYKFFYYALRAQAFIKQVIENSSQATLPIINKSKWENLLVSVPKSLHEQQRIVAILDEVFEAITRAKENAEKNLQNANELLESIFDSEFDINECYWEKVQLSELIERGWIISHLDGNHGNNYPRKEEFIDSGVPYISANCIKNDTVNMSEAKYLSSERANSFRKGVAQNRDVLFAHNATVGPVAVLYTEKEKIILGTSLTYYRCNLDKILPEYLALYMRSTKFVSQYLQIMRQSTRNQIPITKQREFFHVIPPITVQKDIVTRYDNISVKIRRFESIYKQKLIDLEELKKSILQKAFNGEL